MQSKTFHFFLIFVASEVIFTLPFHLPRFFRPEFLDFYHLPNADLSKAQAFYGVVALLCYFPGGLIADYYNPRFLISISLLLTGLAGFALYLPLSKVEFFALYGVWAVIGVLLFWSSFIAFIRNHTDPDKQGSAFGTLEFSRALCAAVFVSFINLVIYQVFDAHLGAENFDDITITVAINFYLFLCFLLAFLCWFFLPKEHVAGEKYVIGDRHRIFKVLRNPYVWCNLLIILCAYNAFKSIDYYSLSLRKYFQWSERSTHAFLALVSWLRPFAALIVGLIADRFSASFLSLACLLLVTGMSLLIYLVPQDLLTPNTLYALLICQLLGIFGVRGVYFALFGEAKVEKSLTGTASGFISFLGYVPEFILPLVSILLLDQNPGVQGFKNFILYVGLVAFVGVIAARFFQTGFGGKFNKM